MYGGAKTITHTHRNDNTLLRNCLYTFTPSQSEATPDEETRLHKTTYFLTHCQNLSTMLNLYHLNKQSCKIPSLSSHTFHLFFHWMHCSSISVQPCYYLIMLKVSQKPGFSPESWTGGTTWQTRTAVCLAVFFQAFVHRMIKRSQGCICCSV